MVILDTEILSFLSFLMNQLRQIGDPQISETDIFFHTHSHMCKYINLKRK